MDHKILARAQQAYKRGENVTDFLRSELGETNNSSEIIEMAYELQAGSYVALSEEFPDRLGPYSEEMYALLKPHLFEHCTILDLGTGELTTLSPLANHIDIPIQKIFGLEISWSRLSVGRDYWWRTANKTSLDLSLFVAEMGDIPLPSQSIDVVITSHALEPNGENATRLLAEIFRVARKCVFFEPSYEMNSEEGKARMDRLGYIKGIEQKVALLGGKVHDVTLMKHVSICNPTACYVVEPPDTETSHAVTVHVNFSVPGTDFRLHTHDGFLLSEDTGIIYPVLDGIPILKKQNGILATKLVD